MTLITDAFTLVDGRYTLVGNPVAVRSVEKNFRGVVKDTSLLSNGNTVTVVNRGDNTLGILTGKGGRFVRVTGDTVINFFVNGELVASVGAEDVEKFSRVE